MNIRINDVVTEKIITLSQLKMLAFPLALISEYKRVINVRNFGLKFQVVVQKTAKDLRGYFILPYPVKIFYGTIILVLYTRM